MAALSLRRVPWVGSPASQVQWAAPTSCRPSRVTSFPSFGGTMLHALFVPAEHGALRSGAWRLSRKSPHRLCMEATGSPRFLGSPCPNVPCSSTPAGRSDLALAAAAVLPSGTANPSATASCFRGSITRPVRSLSTLRACVALGAQDSLPACWLCFGRAGLSPAGLLSSISGAHRSTSLPSRPGLPGAPQIRLRASGASLWGPPALPSGVHPPTATAAASATRVRGYPVASISSSDGSPGEIGSTRWPRSRRVTAHLARSVPPRGLDLVE